jgi:hypothetical protein
MEDGGYSVRVLAIVSHEPSLPCNDIVLLRNCIGFPRRQTVWKRAIRVKASAPCPSGARIRSTTPQEKVMTKLCGLTNGGGG